MKITRPPNFRTVIVLFCVLVVALASSLYAHVVRGLDFPTLATAFVSSPTSGTDAPIPIRWGAQDTGLRIVCFNVANTSSERVDRAGWPRITGVGFELPGNLSGFTLLQPEGDDWELVEGRQVSLAGHSPVTLDFAIEAAVNPTGRTPGLPTDPLGIPPGQAAVRGSGTRFCVSGPFPDQLVPGMATTIEGVLNGVVVGFHGVHGNNPGVDLGVWDNPTRVIPLYP